jgi:hypothetical protein
MAVHAAGREETINECTFLLYKLIRTSFVEGFISHWRIILE